MNQTGEAYIFNPKTQTHVTTTTAGQVLYEADYTNLTFYRQTFSLPR